MPALHAEALPAVREATRFSRSAGWPRPHVAVFGGMHGNEPCGLAALSRLDDELRRGALPVVRGTVLLVHGNPHATACSSRTSERGVDLNRLFDYRFLDTLPQPHWCPEHHRALELRPLLDTLDALIDLHSTTRPTPPFAIATTAPSSLALACALGLEYVTTGWEGPGLLGDRVVIAPLTRRDAPGIAIECGAHDAANAAEVAYRSVRRALAFLGVLDELLVSSIPQRLVVRDALKKPSPSFRFARPIAGMERLSPGEVIGENEDVQLTARRECFAVMPNDGVAVGDDMLYLAVPAEPASFSRA